MLDDDAVSTADVTEWIAQAFAYINSRISSKVTTPVVLADSPNAYAILRTIETLLVCHRIQNALNLQTGRDATNQNAGRDFLKEAKDYLKEILDGTIVLDDAEEAGLGGGVASYAVDEGLEHEFEKGEVQW